MGGGSQMRPSRFWRVLRFKIVFESGLVFFLQLFKIKIVNSLVLLGTCVLLRIHVLGTKYITIANKKQLRKDCISKRN